MASAPENQREERSFGKTSGKTSGKLRGKLRGNVGENFGEMSGKMSGKTESKIVDLIRKNREIAIPEIAEKLKRTERTIERAIASLKEQQIIGRIGPAKGGHWEVLE